MTNVVATPDHNVITNRNERLNGVVFQNEAIITTLKTWKDCRSRAYIADEFITSTLCFMVSFSPDVIHSFEAHRNKHLELVGRIVPLNLVESNHSQVFELIARNEITIDGERRD